MIEKQIEELTAALIDNTKALRELASGSNAAPAAPAAEAPKPERKKKEPAPAPAPAAEPPAAGPTVQDVRAAAQAVLDANGQDAAPLVALAKEYNVKRISEVPADKYAEMIAKLNKLSGAGAI